MKDPAYAPRFLDWLGAVIGLGCGVHCVAMTVLFLTYPALWLNRRYWEMGLWEKMFWLERSLLLTSWFLVAVALGWGYFRHRRILPGLLALTGLGMLTAVIMTGLHFSGPRASVLAGTGGLLVAAAHLLNLRCSRPHR